MPSLFRNAIFLHASWRSGSTYVWSKFRERSDTRCYFEPLTEHLATATPDAIDRFRPWPFANHPALHAPYLDEYRPLTGSGTGIPGFPADLSFGSYCAGPEGHLPELEDWLEKLARLAADRGRRPVYGFVRSDLRLGWFRARMPGKHIFIRREPRRQFMSMLRQAVQGNPYFLQRGLVILHHNMTAPLFAPLLAAIDLPALRNSPEMRDIFKNRLGDITLLKQLYAIFWFMRSWACRLAEAHCDMIMDIDRITLDTSYREAIECGLADLLGFSLSFADCRVERYDDYLGWSDSLFDSLEQDIALIVR
jgi:hypothetical protein